MHKMDNTNYQIKQNNINSSMTNFNKKANKKKLNKIRLPIYF